MITLTVHLPKRKRNVSKKRRWMRGGNESTKKEKRRSLRGRESIGRKKTELEQVPVLEEEERGKNRNGSKETARLHERKRRRKRLDTGATLLHD